MASTKECDFHRIVIYNHIEEIISGLTPKFREYVPLQFQFRWWLSSKERGGRWWGWRPTKPYIRLESSQQSLIYNNIKGNFKPVSVQYVYKNFIGEGGKSPTSSISKMVQKSSE